MAESGVFRFRHFRAPQWLLSDRTLDSVKFLLLASDFSIPLAPHSAQCGDMSVPEPPPPDGLLTGLSDRLEAGEPTPGTAVLWGDCPQGPGSSGWGTPAQATSCLEHPGKATLVPRGSALLGAVCVEGLSLCCFLRITGLVVGELFNIGYS